MLIAKKIVDRFMKSVDIVDDETSCWNWLGSKKGRGYGRFTIGPKNLRAHRVSYMISKRTYT